MLSRRIHILIAAILILVAALPLRADDDVSVIALPGALKLIVREGHSINLAAVDIWVRAGSAGETPEKCGTAHFIEHMIFKATEKYGPGQIDREIETLGADLNGGTTQDYAHFYTTVPSQDLSTALNAIADAIVNPKFRAEDMDKERRIILDEIARSEGDPFQHALDRLAGLMFPNHPYGRPQAGTRDTIAKLTRDDLVSFYSALYTPANTTIVIAGDVSKADAIAMVEKAFQGYDRKASDAGARLVPPVTSSGGPDEASAEPRTQRFPSATSQAYVAVGFRVPGIADFKATCALDALQIIFGSTAHGRIAAALTAQRIPFSKIKTDYVTRREPTLFSVVVAVDPADADKAVSVIVNEYRRLSLTGVTEGELSYARRLIEGSELFEQETFAGQARSLGYFEAIKSYDLALTYVKTVRGVTTGDITALASKHFATDGYAAAILTPEVAE